jgi:molybdopterin molybdotransferase
MTAEQHIYIEGADRLKTGGPVRPVVSHDHDAMLDRAAAVDRVLALRRRVLSSAPTESVSLADAVGRTLVADLVAEVDHPPRSHATMDGYAVDATDDYPLDLREREVYPEDDPGTLEPGEAVRIFTGAPLPPGANAVLKQEEATVEGGRLRGPSVESGTYVYRRGSNVAADETLFTAGERLSPKDTLLLGDLGRDEVVVHERLRVSLLATGTELHEGRQRDLDSPMLAGLVQSWGHDPSYNGTVPDEYNRVRDRIATLADDSDVVVTTGGTSVGKKDHVVRALRDLGDVLFHRVRVRPGKPIAVTDLPDHDAVAVAIPGKPVGALTITTLVARPLFAGDRPLSTVPATLSTDLETGSEGFEYAVPVLLNDGAAVPLGHADSPLPVYNETFDPSVLSSSTRATRADGFFLTEMDRAAGDQVDVVPYPVVE